jgi:4-hydroxy-tetrahydrodipicolinate synthase
MHEQFRGTGVAVVTPFRNSGNIDFSAFEKLLEHIIGNGINYIVTLGTTGESATLSRDEKVAVIDFVLEVVNHRVPVVVGIGGNNTQEVINTIKATSFDRISGILSVSPYYNKPQQLGIYNHYKAIAGACPVPVIMYNVPGRTSSNIAAATTLKLAHEIKNIVGVKEASGNLMQCMEIIDRKPKDFLLISGDDALTLPMLALGGDGVISVVANAFPREFSQMVNLGLKSEIRKARSLHYNLLNIINALFQDGNPSGIKAALKIIGVCEDNVRLPLVQVNDETFKGLESLIQSYHKG